MVNVYSSFRFLIIFMELIQFLFAFRACKETIVLTVVHPYPVSVSLSVITAYSLGIHF